MIKLYTVLTEASLNLYGAMGFDACGENEFLLNIEGKMCRCIKAYFNPYDAPDIGKKNHAAVMFDADESKCYVAEGAYHTNDILAPDLLAAEYAASIMPMLKYRLGMYIKPECIIIKESIGAPPLKKIENGENESWAVYDSAEVMYNEQHVAALMENSKEFATDALYGYYDRLARCGSARKLEHEGWEYTLFIIKDSGQKVLLKKGSL